MSWVVGVALACCGARAAGPAVRVEVVGRAEPFVETVVAAGSDGAVAWWQADAAVWVAPADGSAARATGVGAADLARAAGATPGDGAGSVAGLAVSGRDVLALWRGRVAGRTVAALLRLQGATAARAGEVPLRVEIDSRTLLDALDLGDSLVLADLSLLRSGGELWVLARDLDRARLFHRPLDGYGLGAATELRGEADAPPPELRRNDLAVAAGPGGGLALTATDKGVTRVWLVDTNGKTRLAATLAGLPLGHCPAVAVGDDAPPVLFAADTAHAATDGPATVLVSGGGWLNFPALLRLDADAVLASDRDALHAPADVAVYALDPPRLVPAAPGNAGRLRPPDRPRAAVRFPRQIAS